MLNTVVFREAHHRAFSAVLYIILELDTKKIYECHLIDAKAYIHKLRDELGCFDRQCMTSGEDTRYDNN